MPPPATAPFAQAPAPSPDRAPGPAPDLAGLHPAVWRAQSGGRLAGGPQPTLSTGHAALDAELPGGGWPLRALTELLLPGPGWGEMRLLMPALARVAGQGRVVLLLAPPATLCGPALAGLGLPPEACVLVQPPARLPQAGRRRGGRAAEDQAASQALGWAMEQVLRSGQAGAVLAWPGPQLPPEALRRWQLAAQAHAGPVFVLREPAAARQPSPAPLRLQLQALPTERLAVHLLKRRGPLRAEPLCLALPPVLSARGQARAGQAWPQRPGLRQPVAVGRLADRPSPMAMPHAPGVGAGPGA